MTYEVNQLNAKLVISGAFECRDKDGVLLKTIDFKSAIPLSDLTTEKEDDHGNQRSE